MPLLALKHETPTDSRFVRNFVDVHYRALTAIAALGSMCFALSDRYIVAAGMAWIVFIGFLARREIGTRMDHLHNTMSVANVATRRRFWVLLMSGFLLNIIQMSQLQNSSIALD